MDVIAGLPEENTADFLDTVKQVLALGPENITVHTLAVKRASKLIELNQNYHDEQGGHVREMLCGCKALLESYGYVPYYLYRQKRMAGNLENTGWCKEGTAGIYNIRIMEEMQTIIALGAGGVTKVYYPEENRLERVPNVTNYELYTSRIDEMLQRKKENLFNAEGNEC
jgi:oxygen-independent coproporphyrinogen-3 oxidase